jgi:hypothetical protein
MTDNTYSSNSRTHAIYITIIAILVAALIYTNYMLKTSASKVETVIEEVDEKNELLSKLQLEFDQALIELDRYKGQTVTLDSLLSIREAELMEQKKKIQALISTGGSLAKAEQMIADLKAERYVFQQKVDSLIAVTNQLQYEKIVLSAKGDSLVTELGTQQQLTQRMESENIQMRQKIDKASILTAQNVTGKGIRYKKGKEVETNKSGDVDKLKICFDLAENKIAEAGETELLVRLIGPDGVTIQFSALGSGAFRDANTGNEIPYTYKIRPRYDNEQKNICSLWDQDGQFPKGQYKAHVYQQGYLIGETAFSLR